MLADVRPCAFLFLDLTVIDLVVLAGLGRCLETNLAMLLPPVHPGCVKLRSPGCTNRGDKSSHGPTAFFAGYGVVHVFYFAVNVSVYFAGVTFKIVDHISGYPYVQD